MNGGGVFILGVLALGVACWAFAARSRWLDEVRTAELEAELAARRNGDGDTVVISHEASARLRERGEAAA